MLTAIALTASTLLAAQAPVAQPTAAAAAVPGDPVRGITVSTHGIGRDWGSDIIVETFREIRSLGANWVTVHPYAGIRRDGTLRFRHFAADTAPAHVLRPVREAHANGLKILIKPHLAYWGSGFKWRGEIAFGDDAAAWERFFADYRTWITQLAAACHDADGFVIGTELDLTLDHRREWDAIITAVRQATRAPLTYAANWTDFRRVPFWNKLDVIGIQAYFPVTAEATRDESKLRAGWGGLMADLSAFATRADRHIVFTELGYNRSFQAAVRPWDHHMDGRDAEPVQQACLRVALDAIAREPRVIGAFLWKWFPGRNPRDHNFKLQTPGMNDVIKVAWQ